MCESSISLANRSSIHVLMFFLMLPVSVLAQSDSTSKPAFAFDASSSLNYFWSDRQMPGSLMPAEYLNWNLRANVLLFGLPFNVNTVLSSISDSLSPGRSFISLRFDPRSIFALKHGIANRTLSRHVELLELGKTRPLYSDLMLNGIALDGINAGFRAGKFSVYGAYGISREALGIGFSPEQPFRQTISYGALALGDTRRSYFRVSVLHAGDVEGSLAGDVQYFIQQADTFIHLSDTFFIEADSIALRHYPGESMLIGLETALSLWQNKFRLLAEVAGSANTSNTGSEAIVIDGVPDWVYDVFQPTITTSISYALRVKVSVNVKKSGLDAAFSHLEPGFSSPGVPFMRQDYESIDLRFRQELFKRKMRVNAWYRGNRDNLRGTRPLTTINESWGLSLSWRPRKLPYINLSWSQNDLRQLADIAPRSGHARIASVVSGRSYPLLGKANAFTSASVNYQILNASYSDQEQTMSGLYLGLQQSITLRLPLSINSSFLYSMVESTGEQLNSSLFSLMISYRYKQVLTLGAGIRHQSRQSGAGMSTMSTSLSVKAGRLGIFTVNAEPQFFRNAENPSEAYNRYLVRCSFVSSFNSFKTKAR